VVSVADPEPDDVEVFCRRAWPGLVGGLALWCESRAVAEELAQETLIRVWAGWPRLAAVRDREAWMWRVAINLSRSSHRRARAERRALGRLGELQRVAAEEVPVIDADLVAAVRALPRRQRQAVVLRFVADLPVGTVAGAMGCAEGTVRALTHQGIEQLRQARRHEEVRCDG
jgi:RNA polymerase sigma factor (sigma-70 family)